jgi:serine phosphatase RsbU (regulator of sigma subunit)
VITDGPEAGNTFEVTSGATIGRSSACDIVLPHDSVSRQHARLAKSERGFVIEDLGSSNGTFVNGQMVTISPLKEADEIKIAPYILRFSERETSALLSDTVCQDDDTPSTIVNTIEVKDAAQAFDATQAETPEELKIMHERLRTVLSTSQALGRLLDLSALSNEIINNLFEVFPQADRGFVMIKDERTGELVPQAVRKRGGLKPERISISRTIVNEVVSKCQSVLSADAMQDERFRGLGPAGPSQSIVDFGIRSMMCAPMAYQGEVLGLIHIDTQDQKANFTSEDLDLLTGIAIQAAIAVENVRMHQQALRRERMDRDLMVAHRVQRSFLPKDTPEIPGYSFAAKYSLAYEVGGDFYDFIRLPAGSTKNENLAVVIGDVSGKGISAALLMAKLTSDIRSFVSNEPDPARVITELNEYLSRSVTEEIFVTLLYLILDPGERKISVVNAGHPPALIRRKPQGEVQAIDSNINFPLGVLPETVYEVTEVPLDPGDTVVLYTDGITEAMNRQSKQFGSSRLYEVLKAGPSEPDRVLERIVNGVHEFVGLTPQSDDLTLVCFGPV